MVLGAPVSSPALTPSAASSEMREVLDLAASTCDLRAAWCPRAGVSRQLGRRIGRSLTVLNRVLPPCRSDRPSSAARPAMSCAWRPLAMPLVPPSVALSAGRALPFWEPQPRRPAVEPEQPALPSWVPLRPAEPVQPVLQSLGALRQVLLPVRALPGRAMVPPQRARRGGAGWGAAQWAR